jgi:hypothetical protein
VDVATRGVATFLLTSMSSSSSSFAAKVFDKYSELEVSFSLYVDADVDDPSFSAMLLCGLPMVRTLLLCAFIFIVPSSQRWVDLFDFFLVHITFEFPLLQYGPSTKTYTHDYSYTPNNYFIWIHATHYLKTTTPTKCLRTKNPNKQLLLNTSCYLHIIISLCNLNYLSKHLNTYEDNRGCRNQAVKTTCSRRRVVQLTMLQLLQQALL